MNSDTENSTEAVAKESAHHHWLPIEALQPGMILAKPVHVAQHGVLTMKLGEGSEIRASTIDQLLSCGLECVPVLVESQLDGAQVESRERLYLERLLQIFASPNKTAVPDNCRDFFDALLKAGPLK